MDELLYAEQTYAIRGAMFEVYRKMDCRGEAAPASSRNRSVPLAGPRRSLGSAVVTNSPPLCRERARRVVAAPKGKEMRPPVLPSSLIGAIDDPDQSFINLLARSEQKSNGANTCMSWKHYAMTIYDMTLYDHNRYYKTVTPELV